MTTNGSKWTWIVAGTIGLGEIGMEVPVGVTTARKLPAEFSARNLTRFAQIPSEDGSGVTIQLIPTMLHELGAIGGSYRMLASAFIWWAMASDDASEKLTRRWSPVRPATPEEKAKILRIGR